MRKPNWIRRTLFSSDGGFSGGRDRGKQFTVETGVSCTHSLAGKLPRPVQRQRAEMRTRTRRVSQFIELGSPEIGAMWIEKDRGSFPKFAQARNVAEDQRATAESRFEDRQAER